jgi:hypothetical protein
MLDDPEMIETAYALHVSEHYRRASEQLLHAYQRNKEASRHHEAGAFKAALHHVKLSKYHALTAHDHLSEALLISEKIGKKVPKKVGDMDAVVGMRGHEQDRSAVQ